MLLQHYGWDRFYRELKDFKNGNDYLSVTRGIFNLQMTCCYLHEDRLRDAERLSHIAQSSAIHRVAAAREERHRTRQARSATHRLFQCIIIPPTFCG